MSTFKISRVKILKIMLTKTIQIWFTNKINSIAKILKPIRTNIKEKMKKHFHKTNRKHAKINISETILITIKVWVTMQITIKVWANIIKAVKHKTYTPIIWTKTVWFSIKKNQLSYKISLILNQTCKTSKTLKLIICKFNASNKTILIFNLNNNPLMS
jgi:hypothetical protein